MEYDVNHGQYSIPYLYTSWQPIPPSPDQYQISLVCFSNTNDKNT